MGSELEGLWKIASKFLTLTLSPKLPLPWLLTLVLPHPIANRSKYQLEASRTSLFFLISSPKPHFQMSLQQSKIPHRQVLEKKKKEKRKKKIGSERQKREDGALKEGSIPEEVGTRGGKGEEERRRKVGLSL